MRNLTALAAALAATTGCVIRTSDHSHEPEVVEVIEVEYNTAPDVLWADAGCFYDGRTHSDYWYFEADVDDWDGVYDVVSVWADVYDEWDGSFVESFELYPTDDPYVWYSDWNAYNTYLDCWYPNYTVDIVAYDSWEDYDYLTIWASTY